MEFLSGEKLAALMINPDGQELALQYVLRLRSRKPATTPEVVWRCPEGCLLVAAYDSDAGPVLYFPALRQSKGYAIDDGHDGHHMRGAFWQHDFGRLPKSPRREDLVRLPERAWILAPQEAELPWWCRHLFG